MALQSLSPISCLHCTRLKNDNVACSVWNRWVRFHNEKIIIEQFGNLLQLNLAYSHISVGFVIPYHVFTSKVILNIIWTTNYVKHRTLSMGITSVSCHKLFALWISLYVPAGQYLRIVIISLCSLFSVVWVKFCTGS